MRRNSCILLIVMIIKFFPRALKTLGGFAAQEGVQAKERRLGRGATGTGPADLDELGSSATLYVTCFL